MYQLSRPRAVALLLGLLLGFAGCITDPAFSQRYEQVTLPSQPENVQLHFVRRGPPGKEMPEEVHIRIGDDDWRIVFGVGGHFSEYYSVTLCRKEVPLSTLRVEPVVVEEAHGLFRRFPLKSTADRH
jgi:hypothetical protein